MADYTFSFVRSIVRGNNFVGRQTASKELAAIVAAGGVAHVVGLPRMGKSSLLDHVFADGEAKAVWQQQHGLLPVVLSINTCHDGEELWGALAMQMATALEELAADKASELAQRCYGVLSLKGAGNRYLLLVSIIGMVGKWLNSKFIFVFDELDSLTDPDYDFDKDQLGKIRTLAQMGPMVTSSRRTPQAIERRKFKTSYFDNTGKYIFVTPFTTSEVDAYWLRFVLPFASLDKAMFEKYRKLVQRYVGSHPMLMSVMNNYMLVNDKLQEWSQAQTFAQRYEAELAIRMELAKEFERQMHYLEEQELKEAAIKLVLGATEKPDEADIELLRNYGFIQIVENKVKRKMFGYDLGPTTADNQHRYACLSEFANHLMQQRHKPLIKGIELLEKTEKSLRQLVRAQLTNDYGTDCFTAVGTQTGDYRDYKEKWEDAFVAQKGMADKLNAIKDTRFKRICNDIKPANERLPIDIVSSTTMGELWNVFITKSWNTFYAKVLDAASWSKPNPPIPSFYIGDRNRWYEQNFSRILTLRNAHQHFNDEELTDDFKALAEQACRNICDNIENWMQKRH